MEITLRNPERRSWTSGWGVINRALAHPPLCNSINNLAAPAHLFLSPPNSFLDVDKSKFNIGVTMGERNNLASYKFDFIGLANKMDLLIVPSIWQKKVFAQNGIKVPIEIISLGHDHKSWANPILKGTANSSALIIDRGRDHAGSSNELQKYFEEVNYINCKTPKPTSERDIEIIKKGRYDRQILYKAYGAADVFLKWSREGWCFPLLEAMSAGCLCITNCVHLPYLRPNKNCLVFSTIPELTTHLQNATRQRFDHIKKAAQETAAQLIWESALKNLSNVIRRYAG